MSKSNQSAKIAVASEAVAIERRQHTEDRAKGIVRFSPRTVSHEEMQDALRTLHDYVSFYEQVSDRDTGELVWRNQATWEANGVLDNICWNANRMVDQAQTKLDESKAKAKAEAERYDGTEIAEVALNRSLEWVERRTQLVSTVEKFRENAEAVYVQRTGREYVRKQLSAPKPKTQPGSALARAKALGIEVAHAPKQAPKAGAGRTIDNPPTE